MRVERLHAGQHLLAILDVLPGRSVGSQQAMQHRLAAVIRAFYYEEPNRPLQHEQPYVAQLRKVPVNPGFDVPGIHSVHDDVRS